MTTTAKRLQVVKPAQPAAQPEPTAEVDAPTPAAEPEQQQRNKHDVKRLEGEITALLTTFAQRGVQLNREVLQSSARAYASCRMLVIKGICTEAEMQAEESLVLRSLLLALLQQVEEQQLAQARKVQPVRKPGLVVARH